MTHVTIKILVKGSGQKREINIQNPTRTGDCGVGHAQMYYRQM
jgi:hypothetical protein